MKFGFNWHSGFQRRRCLKMLTYMRTTEAYLYYKLTNEPKGSGELKMVKVNPGSSFEKKNGHIRVTDAVYQVSRSSASWFWRSFFIIYGHGHVNWNIWKIFIPHIPWGLYMKFGFNRPDGFRAKEVWKCWIRVTLEKCQWIFLNFHALIYLTICTDFHLTEFISF